MGWSAALVVALAILVVDRAPWWVFAVVLACAGVSVLVETVLERRAKYSFDEVARRAFGVPALLAQTIWVLVLGGVAAVSGDTEMVVFLVLGSAILVAGLSVARLMDE